MFPLLSLLFSLAQKFFVEFLYIGSTKERKKSVLLEPPALVVMMMFVAEYGSRTISAKSVREILEKTFMFIEECMYRYEGEYDRRITVKVSYIDNLLAHFFVSYRMNYTGGFPVEKLPRNEHYEKIEALQPIWWDVAALVMYVSPNNIDEVERILMAVGDYLINGVENEYVKIMRKLYGVFDDDKLEVIKKIENFENLWQLLIEAIRKHHEEFYSLYWNYVRGRLEKIARYQETILNGSKIVSVLDELSGIELKAEITAEPLDVFRFGGGIFGVMTKDLSDVRIGLTSAKQSTLMCIIDATHELGHIYTGELMKSLSNVEELKKYVYEKTKKKIQSHYVLDEIAVVAFQRIATLKVFGRDIEYHGWYRSKNVEYIVDKAQKTTLEEALQSWIEKVKTSDELLAEIIKFVEHF